jgi:hypothetical protein
LHNEEPILKSQKSLIELIQEEIEKKDLGSLNELNDEVSKIVTRMNHTPDPLFLGLSPSQMSQILYFSFSPKNDVFTFVCKDSDELKRNSMVGHAFYLMEKLNLDGGVKATQTGNLPRSLVREIYYKFFSEDKFARLPLSEEDLFEIQRLRIVLEFAGVMKKRNNKFELTKKGKKILETQDRVNLFTEIFLTMMKKWNWANGDRYSELDQIQTSAIFNFLILQRQCQDWTLDKFLGQVYLEAFPNLVRKTQSMLSPEDEIVNCFANRFLKNICLPLGFLEQKEEGESYLDHKVFYRVTRFFEESFTFSSSH